MTHAVKILLKEKEKLDTGLIHLYNIDSSHHDYEAQKEIEDRMSSIKTAITLLESL